jgi:hypothetical protein
LSLLTFVEKSFGRETFESHVAEENVVLFFSNVVMFIHQELAIIVGLKPT